MKNIEIAECYGSSRKCQIGLESQWRHTCRRPACDWYLIWPYLWLESLKYHAISILIFTWTFWTSVRYNLHIWNSISNIIAISIKIQSQTTHAEMTQTAPSTAHTRAETGTSRGNRKSSSWARKWLAPTQRQAPPTRFEGIERDGELLTGNVFTDLEVYSKLKND